MLLRRYSLLRFVDQNVAHICAVSQLVVNTVALFIGGFLRPDPLLGLGFGELWLWLLGAIFLIFVVFGQTASR